MVPVRRRLQTYQPAVIDVLTLGGDKVAAVTAFLLDDSNAAETFASVGLPADLP